MRFRALTWHIRLPGASLLFNGAPVAVLQALNTCKSMALQRIRGDLDNMLRWYQAAMVALSRRMLEEHEISISECDLMSKALSLPKNLLRGSHNNAPPQQMWAVFRSGLVFGCGAFVYCESLRAQTQRLNPNKSDQPGAFKVDLSQLFADPRLLDQVRSNLDYVFKCLDKAHLPCVWTPFNFLTFPDDDDSFLLIQAYALYQTCSNALPLSQLEAGTPGELEGVDENVLQQATGRRNIWAPDTRAGAFKDINRVLCRDGKRVGSNVRGAWRQSQKSTAFPVMVLNIAAVDLCAAREKVPSTRNKDPESKFAGLADSPETASSLRVASIDLTNLVCANGRREKEDMTSPAFQVDSNALGTAAIAQRVRSLEEVLDYVVPQEEREQEQLEETVTALREEVEALISRVNKWKSTYDEMVKDSSDESKGELSSPPPPTGTDMILPGILHGASPALDLSKIQALGASAMAQDSGDLHLGGG